MTRYFIVAGEASGDILGSGLMRALRELDKTAEFAGVGGEEMAKIRGFHSFFDIKDIAVMGLAEVLLSLRRILGRLEETVAAARKFKPDVIITVDAPGFNLRVAKALKGVAPLVHYVAPSVWAYKPERAERFAEIYDLLLCFFDFERPYFEKYGLRTVAVGHPMVEEIGKYKRKPVAGRIVMLPGSRAAMASRLVPIYKEVAAELGVRAVIPAVATNAAQIRAAAKGWASVIVGKEARYKAFSEAACAVAISGTAVLELALLGVPTVAVYKAAPITYFIGSRLVKIKDVTLPNIILGRTMVRELIQGEAVPAAIVSSVRSLLADASQFEKDVAELRRILLKHRTPSRDAARAVVKMSGSPRQTASTTSFARK